MRYNNILVEGGPGAGKTTLGLGFIHAGAAHYDEPGIFISMELDERKLLRDASGFTWNLEPLMEAGKLKIIQTSPAVLLNEFRTEEGVLKEQLEAIGARRLVIDGLTPLRLYAESHDQPFREDMHLLIEGLTRLGVTTLVTSERDDNADALAHERFVFDTIIRLTRREHHRGLQRRLSIIKSRGQDFIAGSHTMCIAPGAGIEVYRRAQSQPKLPESQPTSETRITTGCETLDQVMDGSGACTNSRACARSSWRGSRMNYAPRCPRSACAWTRCGARRSTIPRQSAPCSTPWHRAWRRSRAWWTT